MNHDVLDPQFILYKRIVLLPQNVFDLHHERVMDGVRGRARGKKARECCGESGRWSEGGGGGGGGGCSLSFVVGGGGGGISGVDRGEISGLNGDGAEQWAASKHYRQMVPSLSRRRCAVFSAFWVRVQVRVSGERVRVRK